jgi:hypothetical protein
MARKYLSFDIETAKVLPEQVGNLLEHRPLGICCAATLSADDELKLWFGKNGDGSPTPQMNREELAELIQFLSAVVENGYHILTWNGLGFDFDVLAEESGLVKECKNLARHHVDMMFQVFCERGFPIGLNSALRGMKLKEKSETVKGHLAPQFWQDGRYDEVLDYVSQDVRCTLDLALACEREKQLRWVNQKGKTSDHALRSGWLTVEKALQKPEPDTSWMDKPMSRSRFTGWLNG